MKSPFPSRSAQGFTLIELLVVMAIITILAGILVPLAPKMLGQAKKVKAKAAATSLQKAISSFVGEYNYLPGSGASTTSADATLMDALTKVGGENPRGIVFLESEQSVSATSSVVFLDPWGRAFNVYLDRDGDGQTAGGSGGDFLTPIIVHSLGADGVDSGSPGVGDDVWTVTR